ncbi:Hsp70 family protein [Plantactinospora sp. KLBMP9567]|uniref:Hsp70 family protein n=1 Tax=Plantactinospora sp. KLBMP9567 TaxID=3085900 RepID=UPI00298141A2|nr:Hsp70 family protein [Plantactinospora sp. KLBMP9567]MDW5322394.1 Hsp70 family protein [Plantactinospora sp. KLBMP9567]
MSADGIVLGVDFGTSNTAATLLWPDGRVRPVLFDGSPLLPSAVCADGGTLLVGRDALQTARANPAGVEPYPKQRIDDGSVLLSDVEYPVVDLIAAVLGRVVDEARRVAGGPPGRMVLAHPAGWGNRRREILRSAAVAAGVPSVDLVVEPVAAAAYFVGVAGSRLPAGSVALVYDLGAGTFDASVVRRTADGFDVLGTEGLVGAGGLDLDAAIIAYLTAVFGSRDPGTWRRLTHPGSEPDLRLRRQLWDDVRTAKESLSRRTSARITLPLVDEDVPLGREQLDALARPLLERTITASRAALGGAGVTPADLAGVYLVGGASRYPLVATLLHQSFALTPTAIEQPELAVAEGAIRPTGQLADLPAGEPPTPVRTRSRRLPRMSRRATTLAAGVAVVLVSAAMALVFNPVGEPHRAGGGDRLLAGAGAVTAGAVPSTPTAAPTPVPTPSRSVAPGVDPCVVGRWRMTRWDERNVGLFGTDVDLKLLTPGRGEVNYGPTGTGWTDHRRGVTTGGTARGRSYRVTHTGTIRFTYLTIGDKLTHTDGRPRGTTVWKIDGSQRDRKAMGWDDSGPPSTYDCTAELLRVAGESSTMEYRRISDQALPVPR